MISNILFSFVSQLSASQATEFFLQLMAIVFLIALTLRAFKKAFRFCEGAPSLLTSMGILGTFVGIIVGLLEFDIQVLDLSIASLLEGLKTAFITSVCGIALSLILKTLFQYMPDPEATGKEVTPHDLLEALESIRSEVRHGTVQQQERETHISQMLVTELKRVVEEFNLRIESEFGENLKVFADNFTAVEQSSGRLVGAIDELYEKTSTIIQYSQENSQSMLNISEQLSVLNNQFGGYFEHMENLFKLLHQSNDQFSELNDKLLDYSARSLEVVNAVPDMNAKVELFNANITELTEVTGETVKQALESLSVHSHHLGERINQVATAFNEVSNLDEAILQGFIEKGVNAYHHSVNEISERQVRMHQELVHSLNDIIQASFAKIQISIESHQEGVDSRLGQELDQVMAVMGQSLAAISGQFTRDYQQLIDQMQRILDRAREVA